jgi:hypothetical protein
LESSNGHLCTDCHGSPNCRRALGLLFLDWSLECSTTPLVLSGPRARWETLFVKGAASSCVGSCGLHQIRSLRLASYHYKLVSTNWGSYMHWHAGCGSTFVRLTIGGYNHGVMMRYSLCTTQLTTTKAASLSLLVCAVVPEFDLADTAPCL